MGLRKRGDKRTRAGGTHLIKFLHYSAQQTTERERERGKQQGSSPRRRR